MKQLLEKAVTGIITCSGFLTSVVLFFITLLINSSVELISSKSNKK